MIVTNLIGQCAQKVLIAIGRRIAARGDGIMGLVKSCDNVALQRSHRCGSGGDDWDQPKFKLPLHPTNAAPSSQDLVDKNEEGVNRGREALNLVPKNAELNFIHPTNVGT